MHALVGAEESHEHWGLDDLDGTVTVDVEVGPGLVEVGIHVLGGGSSLETLVGSKNFLSSVLHVLLAHHEGASWLSTDLGAIIELLDWGSLLVSVLGDHGSHENVVGVGGEVWGDNSLILTIGSSILNGLPGIVGWVLLDDLVGNGIELDGALVWWSGIGSLGGVTGIGKLNFVVIFVSEDGGELPDWLVLSSSGESKKAGNSE